MMAMQQFVAMVVAFFIPRILLSVYGSEINGLVVSIKQFISYFLLVEAGISGARMPFCQPPGTFIYSQAISFWHLYLF